MIKQKLIGSITFILGIIFPIIWIVAYFNQEFLDMLMGAVSDNPVDIFIMAYAFVVDGLLGMVCGILLYKGIKAGYLLGFFIWGGSVFSHFQEMYTVFAAVEPFQEGSFDPYTILLNIITISLNLFVVWLLYKDFKKGSAESIENPSVVLS
jgi:hypothetical protein